MPQKTRMQYGEDSRTQAQKDADTRQWVKEHTHDYRQQATDSVPPEDPSGGYGMPPNDDDKRRNRWKRITDWIAIIGWIAIGVFVVKYFLNL